MTNNYRPDLWGHVEGSWRTAPPSQIIIEQALATECPDCNVNVFIEEHPTIDGRYIIKIAHDETCPWLAKHEQKENNG
jgi:hypothetical protein